MIQQLQTQLERGTALPEVSQQVSMATGHMPGAQAAPATLRPLVQVDAFVGSCHHLHRPSSSHPIQHRWTELQS